MIERKYDPTQPYRFARYGRMSGLLQNKRSPDQQFNTIDETRTRCGYPWQCVATYRDDGISGRYLRKRPGFQRMLRDIEAGLITIDLIVVDTLERLGRAEEIAELRRKLYLEYGILIVAADTTFSDPTGIVGKAVGMVEQIRSTENTRISRHNILRGKKDAARRGRWPGGPPPFGFGLKQSVDTTVTPPEVFSTLVVEPREAAAQLMAFERADATGEGDLRLTHWWNTSPDIPDDFRPLSPFTMGYRLENPIAIGTLRWGAHQTGVVNDTRVIEVNPDGPELIPNFCPAIVPTELYERVQHQRAIRAQKIRDSRATAKPEDPEEAKLIAPQSRGLTLKYLLTGLVRCGCCNSSMRPTPSGRKSKAGRRYVYYCCPRHYEGTCPNSHHVLEDTLREAVLSQVRARLFPPPGQDQSVPDWLPDLMRMVRQELQRVQAEEPDRNAADQEEVQRLEQQLSGWLMTLGNPQLPGSVRSDIEARYAEGKARLQVLQQAIASRNTTEEYWNRVLDPRNVIKALQRLDEVLAGYNPTLGNLELSKHIDVIRCYPDKRVEMRGTMLGLFEGTIELLSQGSAHGGKGNHDSGSQVQVLPRRRGRLHVPNLSADATVLTGDVDTALDPERFANVPECFFWTESVKISETQPWSEEHAMEVARARGTGKTVEQLSELFQVSVPTIRKALRIAVKADPSLKSLLQKLSRLRWEDQHYQEVAELHQQGLSLGELCRHFGRSEPLIRAALRLAEQNPQVVDTGNHEGNPPPTSSTSNT